MVDSQLSQIPKPVKGRKIIVTDSRYKDLEGSIIGQNGSGDFIILVSKSLTIKPNAKFVLDSSIKVKYETKLSDYLNKINQGNNIQK